VTAHTALAVTAALVGLAFSFSTYERWLARRRRNELAWSLALGLFSLAAFALAAGSAIGWSQATFRTFYLVGAIANVPVLALGTIYLLAGERRGDWAAVVVVVFTVFAAGVMAVVPFTHAVPRDTLAQGSDVLPVLPRVLAGVGSGGATMVIIGGALYSAWRFRRGRMLWSNLLIASGAGILAGSGILNSVFDEITGFVVSLALGITVLFAGFLVASTASRVEPKRRLEALPTPETLPAERGAGASQPGPSAATRQR
jgi:MFS family permease